MAAAALFGDPFRRFFVSSPVHFQIPGMDPPLDWFESSKSHCFKLDIPGYEKDKLKVEVDEDNVLHIKGEREKPESQGKDDAVWHAAERGGAIGFHRAIQLPKNVKVDQIKAQLENGVLSVLVPKHASPKASNNARTIHISSKL